MPRSVAHQLDRISQERLREGPFDDTLRTHDVRASNFRRVEFVLDAPSGDIGLRRHLDRFPFVPDDPERLAQDCYEAYNLQVSGLEQRLRAIGGDTWYPKGAIVLSGCLDSPHPLITPATALDLPARPRRHTKDHTRTG